jgi:hypothetical protein
VQCSAVQCWGTGALQRGMSHVGPWQRGFGTAAAMLLAPRAGDLPLQEAEWWRGRTWRGRA